MFDDDPFFEPEERMPDFMIDCETVGTRPSAPIIAIGIVCFDSSALKTGEVFYSAIDLSDCVRQASRVIEPNTVTWWLQQPEEAREVLRNGRSLRPVLQQISDFLDRHCVERNSRKVWAAGIDFDCVTLREHYHECGMQVPWEFWNQRDYRTVRNLWPNIEQDARVNKHHALEDAEHQVKHLFKIRRALRGHA